MTPDAADRRRVLVLGASSFVGERLVARLGPEAAVGTYCRRPVPAAIHFDAERMDLAGVVDRPDEFSHAVILLGNTNPDACARDAAASRQLNVTSIEAIIDRLRAWGVMPVFLSTEAVFDGEKGHYVETDDVNPLMTYAAQKVEVERYLAETCPRFLIVRLARVLGSGRDDGTLLTGWLAQVERDETIRCAHDNVLSPIHVEDVTDALVALIRGACTGVFHLANPESHTRLALLETLVAEYRRHHPRHVAIAPCRLADFLTLEPRPRDISLNPAKLMAATGLRPRSIGATCREVVGAWFAERVPA